MYVYVCALVYVCICGEGRESNVDTSCGKFNIAINSALSRFFPTRARCVGKSELARVGVVKIAFKM